jgi:hypothetical protein
MQAAASAFGVPIVGGHTCRIKGPSVVSCAIIGRAEALLESDRAQPGDALLYAVDLRGTYRSPIAFNAATTKKNHELRSQLAVLPELAELGVARAAKDVSNAGLLGTAVMLLESSGVGAEVDLAAIPAPEPSIPARWLMAFPSFGFLLSVAPDRVGEAMKKFHHCGVTCERIGTVTLNPELIVRHGATQQVFCDTRVPFTGWGQRPEALAG